MINLAHEFDFIKIGDYTYINKNVMINIIREGCKILEDPYAVYIFNKLLDDMNKLEE